MSGTVPLLPYTPSWRGQGQLYLYHFTIVKHILTLLPENAAPRKLLGVGWPMRYVFLSTLFQLQSLLSAELYM